MELCLGTVQFGLKYGISGYGQPDLLDCIDMLDYAYNAGIKTFDTAAAYGIAEEVVGEFIKQKKISRNSIKIISKTSPTIFKSENRKEWYIKAKESLLYSLDRLNTDYLDGYMLHSANDIYDSEVIYILNKLKDENLVKSIGASIYTTEEAEKTIEYEQNTIIQIPYNIFDQRLNKAGFFESEKLKIKDIYARSAFLQGLLVMNISKVPTYLKEVVPLIEKFDRLCYEYGVTRAQAAIDYVKENKRINYLVFGVDNLFQLKEINEMFQRNTNREIIKIIANEFANINERLIMPNLWTI